MVKIFLKLAVGTEIIIFFFNENPYVRLFLQMSFIGLCKKSV